MPLRACQRLRARRYHVCACPNKPVLPACSAVRYSPYETSDSTAAMVRLSQAPWGTFCTAGRGGRGAEQRKIHQHADLMGARAQPSAAALPPPAPASQPASQFHSFISIRFSPLLEKKAPVSTVKKSQKAATAARCHCSTERRGCHGLRSGNEHGAPVPRGPAAEGAAPSSRCCCGGCSAHLPRCDHDSRQQGGVEQHHRHHGQAVGCGESGTRMGPRRAGGGLVGTLLLPCKCAQGRPNRAALPLPVSRPTVADLGRALEHAHHDAAADEQQPVDLRDVDLRM